MLRFEDVFHARLEPLNEAVGDWETQVNRLTEMIEPSGDHSAQGMARSARTANWSGENAAVTVPHVVRQADQFDAALRQATSLRDVCGDAYQRLKGCQDELTRIVETEAPAAGVHVSASGRVNTDLDGLDGETRRERQDAVIRISNRIEDVLRRANDHDEVIAQALRDTMGTDPHRFNPVAYDSVGAAAVACRHAETARDLMDRGDELTDEEVDYLSNVLSRHADDPVFAELVATGLGPQGVVDFWRDVTNSRDIDDGSDQWDRFAGLQENLGTVLGVATRSDSDAMERWERDMIALGDERVGGVDGPYGFQAMSALMNAGAYEPEFLVGYGEALLTFEREAGRPAPRLWDSDPFLNLNFMTDDAGDGDPDGQPPGGNAGRDPVTGFLTALGSAPEAATAFFAPPDDFDPTAHVDPFDTESAEASRDRLNDHMAYLATEREWWSSVDHRGPPESLTVHPSLGDALLAATTGHAADTLDSEGMRDSLISDLRTPETSAVMEQVVHLYGTHEPGLLAEQPQMAERLSHMASAYIDDINYVVSGTFDTGMPDIAETTFVSPYGDRLDNTNRAVTQFLYELGRYEEAHTTLSQTQHIYTLSALDLFEPVDENAFAHGEQALRAGATARGILDEARTHQIEADFGDDAAGAQRAASEASSWWKAGSNSLIGVGAGAAAVAATGAAGPAAVVIPLAAPAAGVFLGEFLGQQIDGAHGSQPNPAEQLQLTGNLHQDSGAQLGSVAEHYESESLRHFANDFADNAHRATLEGYDHGAMTGGRYGG
ncbi:hypothetical protein [Streptomyces johnsoniae]|uniref:WXG100 family type VII secretion target n=1 Tax=Streptomyces johnsoniae TaxID=3075532 RepID=A0ABU2S1P5_9ACTN|nr:hypothetical protein [Streptomyces sp. DSM 41886]MDT0441510.1 hypothetical protein [Streptomyces sp. DSM 41886]